MDAEGEHGQQGNTARCRSTGRRLVQGKLCQTRVPCYSEFFLMTSAALYRCGNWTKPTVFPWMGSRKKQRACRGRSIKREP